MTAIRVSQLSKSYKLYSKPYHRLLDFLWPGKGTYSTVIQALKNIDLEVEEGQTLAVVGDNGAGKTTFLKLLSGSVIPTSGVLKIKGTVAGILDLGVGFHPGFNAWENLRMSCSIHNVEERKIPEKIGQIIEFAELSPEILNRPISTYSAGMLMRLAFAASINVDADILVIDEILAVGDQYFQRKCIEKIKQIVRSRKTVVIASHSLHLVKNLCEKAVWFEAGMIKAFGPAGPVIDSYIEKINSRERTMLSASAETPVAEKPKLTGFVEGTGEARIQKVTIRDRHGNETSRFRTGDPMIVEVEFEAFKPVTSPIFGVAIHRKDGIYCCGPNTMYDGYTTGVFTGRHVFAIRYEQVPLLAGDYFFSVAIYDREHVYPFDWHNQLYQFSVTTDCRGDGLVHIPHAWTIDEKKIG
jgi:teichoic acid transport system ATP-binding protein